MELVRVWTDVGARKPVPLLAKIIKKTKTTYTIQYLTEGDDHIWRYEDDTYDNIDEESIAKHLKTSNEEDIGFVLHEDGFIRVDSDEDYITESEEDEEDFEDSDTESDEEEYDDEDEEEETVDEE